MNFQLETGDCLVVTGPNGSGKTTLLRLLVGLLTPTKGTVLWHLSSSALTPREFRPFAGALLPDAEPYGELTGWENLRLSADLKGARVSEGVEWADRFGLKPFLHQPVKEYSSGMRLRLRLAVALVGSPKALLLDEPFAFLDESGRWSLQQVISEQRNSGLVIVATNDPRDLSYGTKILDLGQESMVYRPQRRPV